MALRPRQAFGPHHWFCSGRRTRTADLEGMNLTSYRCSIPQCDYAGKFPPLTTDTQKECKTLTLFFIIRENYKKFALFSSPKWAVSITFNYE